MCDIMSMKGVDAMKKVLIFIMMLMCFTLIGCKEQIVEKPDEGIDIQDDDGKDDDEIIKNNEDEIINDNDNDNNYNNDNNENNANDTYNDNIKIIDPSAWKAGSIWYVVSNKLSINSYPVILDKKDFDFFKKTYYTDQRLAYDIPMDKLDYESDFFNEHVLLYIYSYTQYSIRFDINSISTNNDELYIDITIIPYIVDAQARPRRTFVLLIELESKYMNGIDKCYLRDNETKEYIWLKWGNY